MRNGGPGAAHKWILLLQCVCVWCVSVCVLRTVPIQLVVGNSEMKVENL